MSVTEADRRMPRSKDTARAEQLGRALSAAFTRAELETLMRAGSLVERLGERI